MDSLGAGLRLRKCGLVMIGLLIGLLMTSAASSYSIGVGIADVTGPVAEIVFMGYAKMEQKGSGLHLRLFSRAFIIDDGVQRFVFVSVDSAMVGHGMKSAVIQKLNSHYGDLYTESNVMISGTHTHSSPGGFMMDVLFDISTLGFVKQSFDALVDGISKSIDKAHSNVRPGRIFVARGEVLDANINRSPLAYLNNPEHERKKYKYDVDKDLVQMQFIAADGRPLGVINWFAVHPTSMNNTNHLVSSDNVGYASILFEKRVNKNSMIGKGDFVAAFASTNLGDVSPNTRGPKCEFSGKNCSDSYTCPGHKEMCFSSGPGRDMFESTSIIAHKIFDEAWNLWTSSNRVKEVKGPVRVVHRFVDMPEQNATFYNHTTSKVEQVHGCRPAMGYSFAAGTTDGPGSFAFEQGTTTPNAFWNIVRNFLAKPTEEDIRCHGAKPILLATGLMVFPYQWQPKVVSTQLALLGNVVLAGVPGEFTTMSGRRLRDAVRDAVLEAEDDFGDVEVVVAGLCNTYSDYITTPEEYQIQRYEGASTIYGPHTLSIYLKQYAELARHAVLDEPVESGPLPADLSKEKLIGLQPPVLFDKCKFGSHFGDCVQQPMRYYSPGDLVTVRFLSGHPRNNLMTESTFLTVERLEDGKWIPVATDANWETKFIWERTSVMYGTSQAIIKWEIPETVLSGEYRIRHNGYYRNLFTGIHAYEGVSNHFLVESPNMNYSK